MVQDYLHFELQILKLHIQLLENAFDLNHDGRLDAFERASEFAFFTSIMEEEEHNELADAGIDPEELGYMSGKERRDSSL